MNDRGIQFYQTYQHAEQIDMPHIDEMLAGRFLKKEDIPGPQLVTIASLKKDNVAMANDEPEFKWTMKFEEHDQPLVMNPTNIQLAADALGSKDTDDWIGKKIVLYVDKTVSMGGKLVGGLRLRARKDRVEPEPEPAPRKQATAPVRGSMQDMDDDIPF